MHNQPHNRPTTQGADVTPLMEFTTNGMAHYHCPVYTLPDWPHDCLAKHDPANKDDAVLYCSKHSVWWHDTLPTDGRPTPAPFPRTPDTEEEQELLHSYQTYLRALDKMQAIDAYVKHETPEDDPSLVAQAVYEEVFTQAESQAWDRWVAGGNATTAEWRALQVLEPKVLLSYSRTDTLQYVVWSKGSNPSAPDFRCFEYAPTQTDRQRAFRQAMEFARGLGFRLLRVDRFEQVMTR